MRRLWALLLSLGLLAHGLQPPLMARPQAATFRAPLCTPQGIVWQTPSDDRPQPAERPCCRFGLCCGWHAGIAPLPLPPGLPQPALLAARRPRPGRRRLRARRRFRAHLPRAPPIPVPCR